MDKDYKPRNKRTCFKYGKTGYFIANCSYNNDDKEDDKKGRRRNYLRRRGTHIGKEWDSDASSSDSNNEGIVTLVINKSSLFPKVGHKCLMAKGNKMKVYTYPNNHNPKP
jgi:hypothetical protein